MILSYTTNEATAERERSTIPYDMRHGITLYSLLLSAKHKTNRICKCVFVNKSRQAKDSETGEIKQHDDGDRALVAVANFTPSNYLLFENDVQFSAASSVRVLCT